MTTSLLLFDICCAFLKKQNCEDRIDISGIRVREFCKSPPTYHSSSFFFISIGIRPDKTNPLHFTPVTDSMSGMHYLSEDEFLCNNPDTPVYNLQKWSNYIKSHTALYVVEVQNLLNDAHEDVKKVDGKPLLFVLDALTLPQDQGPWLLSEPKFGTVRSETQTKLTPRFCKKEYKLNVPCSRFLKCSALSVGDIENFCQALSETIPEDVTTFQYPESSLHTETTTQVGSTDLPDNFLPNSHQLRNRSVDSKPRLSAIEQTFRECSVQTLPDSSEQAYTYKLDSNTDQSLGIAVEEETIDGQSWQRLQCVNDMAFNQDPDGDVVSGDLDIFTGDRLGNRGQLETTSTPKGTKSGLWNCTIVSCSRGKYLLNDTCLEPRLLTVTMDLPTERPVNATVSVNDLVAELRRAILAYPGMKVTNLGERVLSDSGTNQLVMHFQISGVFDRDTDSQFPISGHVWRAVSTYLSLPAMPGAIHLCLMSPGPDEKIIGTRCNWIKAREIDNKEVVVGGNSNVNPFLRTLDNAKIEIGSGNCSSVVTNGSSISQCSTSNQATKALSDGDGKNGASSSLTSIWSSPRPDNPCLTPTVTLALRILVIVAMTSTGLTESGIIPRSLHPF